MIHERYKAGSLRQSNQDCPQKLKQILGKAYHVRKHVSWGQTCAIEPWSNYRVLSSVCGGLGLHFL